MNMVLLQWKEVKPEELMDSKLRCVFEFPDDKKQTSATEGTLMHFNLIIFDTDMKKEILIHSTLK